MIVLSRGPKLGTYVTGVFRAFWLLMNIYHIIMNDSFANMSHACVCMSTYSYLASLAPHLLINRCATVGQTQFCSRCHEGSSADRVFRWSFYEHVLAFTQSATSKHSILINSRCLSSLPGWLGRFRSTRSGL